MIQITTPKCNLSTNMNCHAFNRFFWRRNASNLCSIYKILIIIPEFRSQSQYQKISSNVMHRYILCICIYIYIGDNIFIILNCPSSIRKSNPGAPPTSATSATSATSEPKIRSLSPVETWRCVCSSETEVRSAAFCFSSCFTSIKKHM